MSLPRTSSALESFLYAGPVAAHGLNEKGIAMLLGILPLVRGHGPRLDVDFGLNVGIVRQVCEGRLLAVEVDVANQDHRDVEVA